MHFTTVFQNKLLDGFTAFHQARFSVPTLLLGFVRINPGLMQVI